MKSTFLSAIALLGLVCGVGCQEKQRTTPVVGPVVTPPGPAMPAQDRPPEDARPSDPTTISSVKPAFQPAVPDEDKATLLYQAQLDLLRILICSDEAMVVNGEDMPADVMRQQAAEHFSSLGFRVLDGSPCPAYDASPARLSSLANQRDVDMFVLLRGTSKQVDKLGNFYSFEAEGRAKVAQIVGNELVTTQSAFVRGKRGLNAQQAAESALIVCGDELAKKCSDEILRKSARGALLRRVRVDGLRSARLVDYVRVGLTGKPGVQSVELGSWDQVTGTAVFWVRLDASAKENLAAYLEQLADIRLRVERLDQTGADSR
jgi:hypothetical protein